MGKQSSRIYYQRKDHKDIYFQGHYHDAMYVGSQLVWKKIRERNWEKLGFHAFKDNGNAYIAYDAQDKLYYFDRDSKEWVLSEVPDVEIHIGCAENGLFIANEYIEDNSLFAPSTHNTERIFISRDGKSWQNVGYIKETGSSQYSIITHFATDGTNIVAMPNVWGRHIHYGTIASSGEWERSEYVTDRDMMPGRASKCGGFLLAYHYDNFSQTAYKSFDVGRTWTSFDISETGLFVDGVSSTPNFVGGKIFIIAKDSERNFLSIVNPNNGFPEKVLEASNDLRPLFKYVIIDNRSGLFGFSNGYGFYQSKDGYTWEKVEQNFAYSEYRSAGDTIFIPNVGCFMSQLRGYGQFCENPFDRYV